MRRPITALCCALALAGPLVATPAGATIREEFETLRRFDRRLADVAYRLTTANAALCRDLSPTPGMVVHALQQYGPAYRQDARAAFGFARPVAVEAVVDGGPAAQAGVRQDDALVSVNGIAAASALPDDAPQSSRDRDAAVALIAAQPVGAPLRLELVRGGRQLSVTIGAPAGCRAQFEVLLDAGRFAQSDGAIIQIGKQHFERQDDIGIAIAAAHELAHTILRHRERLLAAGVARGRAAGRSSRDRRITRGVEEEADRLSVHLLRNAGYDPSAAVRYWQARAGPLDALAERTHQAPARRAAAIADEIARLAQSPDSAHPAILGRRDSPISN